MKRILTTLSQKWPEYLLEILVITFGILGAFALNSWNEGRKKAQEQQEIVANLHEEFSTNLVALEGQISRLERKNKMCIFLLQIVDKDSIVEQNSLDTLITNLFDSPSWNPSTYVLSDLRNTGQLKSLKNEKLKQLLHNWEQHYENLKEAYTLQFDVLSENFEVISEEGSLRNTASNQVGKSRLVQNSSLLQSTKFENIVSRNYIITNLLLNIYKNETLELINDLLKETE